MYGIPFGTEEVARRDEETSLLGTGFTWSVGAEMKRQRALYVKSSDRFILNEAETLDLRQREGQLRN